MKDKVRKHMETKPDVEVCVVISDRKDGGMEETTAYPIHKIQWFLVKFAQFNRWNIPSSAIYILMLQVSTVIILESIPHMKTDWGHKDLARNKLEENKLASKHASAYVCYATFSSRSKQSCSFAGLRTSPCDSWFGFCYRMLCNICIVFMSAVFSPHVNTRIVLKHTEQF